MSNASGKFTAAEKKKPRGDDGCGTNTSANKTVPQSETRIFPIKS